MYFDNCNVFLFSGGKDSLGLSNFKLNESVDPELGVVKLASLVAFTNSSAFSTSLVSGKFEDEF